MTVRKQVTITNKQFNYLDKNSISLSRFIQLKINERMKKETGRTPKEVAA